MDVIETTLDTLMALAFMLGVPGYFALQPFAVLRLHGVWRLAALTPLLIFGPCLVFSLYALSRDSNLWPLSIVLFAPIGALYLLILLLMHGRIGAHMPFDLQSSPR